MTSIPPLTPRRVCYIHTESLIQAVDALPANIDRASLVHDLIKSLNLLDLPFDEDEDTVPDPGEIQVERTRARVVAFEPATRQQLERFHDSKYIDALLGVDPTSDSDSESSSSRSSHSASPPPNFHLTPHSDHPSPRKRPKLEEKETFGLEDDCPLFPELPEYAKEVAGASIQAARELREGRSDVAICWTGGRHHAQRGSASGFCYIADIVLAILELRLPSPRPRPSSSSSLLPPPPPPKIDKVLYIDLDLHHGDGVESAFLSSSKVLTLSLHLHGPCFFPSTGSLSSTGPTSSPSAFHALNLALEPGLSSSNLKRLFKSCIVPIYEIYDPDVVVVQCGVDGVAGDPCKEWNLDLRGMGDVLEGIVGWGKRTLLFGGGGYNSVNAARCWSYFTSVALGRPLDLETPIPPSLERFIEFSPGFTLDVQEGTMMDRNTDESLNRVEEAFRGYFEKLEEKYKKVV